VGDFFAKRRGDVLKPRRNISSVIAGKAITEIDVSENIEEYQLEIAKKKNKPNGSKIKKIVNRNRIRNIPIMNNSLGLQKKTPKSLTFITVIYEDVNIRDEKCCVCGDFEPMALRDKPYIEFVKWAHCVVCCHWVHLSYCVPEKWLEKTRKLYVCIVNNNENFEIFCCIFQFLVDCLI
jgi:hypothetical protein